MEEESIKSAQKPSMLSRLTKGLNNMPPAVQFPGRDKVSFFYAADGYIQIPKGVGKLTAGLSLERFVKELNQIHDQLKEQHQGLDWEAAFVSGAHKLEVNDIDNLKGEFYAHRIDCLITTVRLYFRANPSDANKQSMKDISKTLKELYKGQGGVDACDTTTTKLLDLVDLNTKAIGQFDFFATYLTFREKLTYLINKLPENAPKLALSTALDQVESHSDNTKSQRYEMLVDKMYEALQRGFNAVDKLGPKDFPHKWEAFDAMLPVVHYLSSFENPFMRENLFAEKTTLNVESRPNSDKLERLINSEVDLKLSSDDLEAFGHFTNQYVYRNLDAAAQESGSLTNNSYIEELIGKPTSHQEPTAEDYKRPEAGDVSTIEARAVGCGIQ